ncbi:15520_t:CDS:2 [Funneliformis geosporum]|uniref:7325_t:CDS:1 n=1 Tax=Funneliformis geosporum TaxID=1117311 RepID=A0A9W4SCE4_9GLOM|nr:15520_t:CDS:2 [Funneliformis geosporum]CAI2163254.1 7325_t:CDS:2 [Funneliformis geosporum]
MLRGAKHILKKKNLQKSVNNNSNNFRKLSQKTTNLKEFGNNVTIEETSLIVKRCVEQIRLRGLNTVNIFKPMRIGDGGDEVKYLLNCLLNDNIPEFEDEIQSQDINNIVSAMKWALRHCKCIIIPFNNYESFNFYEQEMNYDVRKGLFTNNFLNSIPKLNREIILELFDICIQLNSSVLPSNSDIDNNPLKIIKSLALCLIGYNDDEKERNFTSFDDAYREWIKSSNACHEYQKEIIQTADFPESPTISNKSRKHFRKRSSLIYFSAPSERPISILRVTRTVPPGITNNGRKSRCPSILLPEMLDNLNRRTIVRTSTMMTLEEQNIAEKIWKEFQRNGIASLSDDYIKLFFSLDEKMINENLHKNMAITPIEKNWKDFSKKGFKSFYLEPPLPPKKKQDKNNVSLPNNKNDNGKTGGNELDNEMRPKTIAWDDFTTKGFRDSLDNLSDVLTLASSVKSPLLRDNDHDYNISNVKSTTTTTATRNDGKKHKIKRGINLRSLKKKSFDSNNDFDYNEHEEDWEDWYVIDPAQDFQVTTHLAIETIDEIFPYIWIETTSDEVTNRWGEWVFVEPRQDLINHECEWIMIEEKEQILNIWDDSKVRGRGKLRRKSNAFSTFSLPWVRAKSNNNNKREDKTDSKLTRSSSLPRHSGSFDNSDVEGHNARRKRISTKDISAPIPIDYTEEMSRRLTSQGYDSETGMMEMGYTNENKYNHRLTQTSHIMPTQYETVAEYDEEYENYAEGYGGDRNGDEYAEENDYYDEYDETADRNSMGENYYDENTDYIEHLDQYDETRNEHTGEGYHDDDYTTNTQYGYL